MKAMKDKHTPAAERKLGITALKYYAVGTLLSVVWVALFALGDISKNVSLTRGIFDEGFKVAYIADQNVQETRPSFFSLLIQAANATGLQDTQDVTVTPFDISREDEIESLRYCLFLAAFLMLALWVLMGTKLSIIRAPTGLPRNFGCLTLLSVMGYAATYLVVPGDSLAILQDAAFTYLPILVFLCVPVSFMVAKEWIKESNFYRDAFVLGAGGEQSRMGGVKAYIQRDITDFFNRSQKAICKTPESRFYLGESLWYYDYKVGQRVLGAVSEQHLMLNAGSGGGKSRDIISNNLVLWNGGMVVFDLKGEHANFSYQRRSKYAPAYLVDPFNVTKSDIRKEKWNPLAGIDPKHPFAPVMIKRVCEALVPKNKGEGASDEYFREVPQNVLAGYIAHVLSALPEEHRHLPAVYDLIMMGCVKGGETRVSNDAIMAKRYELAKKKEQLKEEELSEDPQALTLQEVTDQLEKLRLDLKDLIHNERIDRLIKAMATNHAVCGLPQEAAKTLMQMHEKARSQTFVDMVRALGWMKNPAIRDCLESASTFTFSECKQQDATVYFCLPKFTLLELNRFVRLFYQCAFDQLDENNTPQPKGSKRRTLFLFDEVEALGYFEPLKNCFLRERSSFIKALVVTQNIDQLADVYNIKDFTANADKMFFSIDKCEDTSLTLLEGSLGNYTIKSKVGIEGNETVEKEKLPLIERGELGEFLNADRANMIFVPMKGNALRLGRSAVYKNFKNTFHV